MLPGCGCCDCICCDGTPPAEVDVAITFVDDECTKCNENVSGTYTLAHVGCAWEYAALGDSFTDVNCRNAPDPYPNFWYDGLKIRYEMWCVDGSTLAARVWIMLMFKRSSALFNEWDAEPTPTCPPAGVLSQAWVRSTYLYETEFARAGFDCSTDTVVLDYVTRYCSCTPNDIDVIGLPGLPCLPNFNDLPEWFGCKDPPATLSMVPVP